MKTLFLPLLIALLTGSAVALAGVVSPSQQVQAVTSQGVAATRGAMSSLAEDKSLVFWKDMERVGIEEGQIRDFKIKAARKISSGEFFPRYGQALGLGANDQMVDVVDRPPDPWQLAHSRFKQQYKGLDVIGADYSLVIDGDGNVRYAIGKIVTGLDLDTAPTITEAQALDAAKAAVGAQIYPWEADPEKYSPPVGRLAVSSKRLVYRFVIQSNQPFGSWNVEIDALTGDAVNMSTNVVEFDAPGDGTTCFHGTRPFVVDKTVSDDGSVSYRLHKEGPPRIVTSKGPEDWNLEEVEDFVDGDGHFDDPEMITKMAATVHWAVQQTVDYYAKNFGWIGLDGAGADKIEARLLTTPTGNAGVYGDNKLFFRTFSVPEKPIYWDQGCNNSVDMIVVAHEFTHGVHGHAVDYVYDGETGALAEGFGTAFGFLVKSAATGVDWCNGFVNFSPEACKKFWSDTSSDPTYHLVDTYNGNYYKKKDGACGPQNDYCHCHANAHLVLNWLHLLDEGGEGENDFKAKYEVAAIGREKAATIAFKTMTTMPASANYQDVRRLSIAIAEQLYGTDSAEAIAVTNAWYAVGVGQSYEEAHRDCDPIDHAANVEGWPTKLSCKVLPNEAAWEYQISPSMAFDQEVQTIAGKLDADHVTGEATLKPQTLYFWRIHSKIRAATTDTAPANGGILSFMKGLFVGGSKTKSPPVTTAAIEAQPQWGSWSPVRQFITMPKKGRVLSPDSGWLNIPYKAPTINLVWKSVPGTGFYKVRVNPKNPDGSVMNAPSFESTVLQSNGEKVSVYCPNAACTNNKYGYQWSVQPMRGNTQGTASDPISFPIGPPAPIQMSPNGASFEWDQTPSFTWQIQWYNEYAADSYALEILDSHGSPVRGLSTQEHVNVPVELPPGVYQWRVGALGPNGLRTPSGQLFSFTKKEKSENQQPPAGGTTGGSCSPITSAPSTISPGLIGADSMDQVGYYECYISSGHAGFKLGWNPVSGATHYRVNVSWYGNASSVFSKEYTTTETSLIPLNVGYEYGWSVQAKNDCMSDYGPASPIRYFSCYACAYPGTCGWPMAPH